MTNKYRSKIGILQGRVLPPDVNKLQFFPSDWSRELELIKKVGFEYVELLDDKEGKLRNILREDSLSLFSKIKQEGLKVGSVCADFLCGLSLLENRELFFTRLDELLKLFSFEKDLVLVIPFFDANIISAKDVFGILQILSDRYDEELARLGMVFALEIDLPIDALVGAFQELKPKNIGMCYDIGNNLNHRDFDIPEDISKASIFINHVHIKDKQEGKNIRIRKGSERLRSAFSSLRGSGYGGIWALETCITPDPLKEAEYNLNTALEYLNL